MSTDCAFLLKRLRSNHFPSQARTLVIQSDGIEQTRALAQDYVDKAIRAIAGFPESDAKVGLIDMCSKVMKRRN